MKFSSPILLSVSFLLPLALGIAVSGPDDDFELMKRENDAERYVYGTLPNGKSYIAVYNGDVLEGTIVQGDNDEGISYDAYGTLVEFDGDVIVEDDNGDDDNDGDDHDGDDDDDSVDENYNYKRAPSQRSRVVKRQRLALLGKFSGFINEYGGRAWVSQNFQE